LISINVFITKAAAQFMNCCFRYENTYKKNQLNKPIKIPIGKMIAKTLKLMKQKDNSNFNNFYIYE